MQNVLDTFAATIANTPLKASTRRQLIQGAVAGLDATAAKRFTDIAMERGEFAPSDSE